MTVQKIVVTDQGVDFVAAKASDPRHLYDMRVELITSLQDMYDVTFDPLSETLDDAYNRFCDTFVETYDHEAFPDKWIFTDCWNKGFIRGEDVDAS